MSRNVQNKFKPTAGSADFTWKWTCIIYSYLLFKVRDVLFLLTQVTLAVHKCCNVSFNILWLFIKRKKLLVYVFNTRQY